MNIRHLDSFSKELNSIASYSSKQKDQEYDEEDIDQLPLALNKMNSDHIQLKRRPSNKGQSDNSQKLLYAKSLNYDPSGQSFYQDQISSGYLLNQSIQKERANRSVTLLENSIQQHNGGKDLDRSFNQHNTNGNSRKYSNYAHHKIQNSPNYRQSNFSQQGKRPNLKSVNNQRADESSSSSFLKDHSKGRSRKISFAGNDELERPDQNKKSAFQFPPPNPSGCNKIMINQFVKQDSLSIDRAPTASTRPQTTAFGSRQQYFRFVDSKGFNQTPQNISIDAIQQQNAFSNSFISDKNDFSINRPSTTNISAKNKLSKRDHNKQSISLISQLNSTTKSMKPNEVRNQYDLDKNFLKVFNQTQFSHGEGNNTSARYLQFRSIGRNDRKSVNSNHSKRGSMIGNSEILGNLVNLSPNATAINFSTPNQSILKKRQSRSIQPMQINSPKLLKYDGLLDEITSEREENCKKIEQSLRDIEEDNFRNVFPNLKELISRAVDTNDLKLFCTVAEFMADLAFEMQDINAAAFLFEQLRNLSTYTKNHQKKAKSLLYLAKCARQINFYSEAIILLKKSLQYAWYSKENDIELEIYDEFGRNYHYQGNLQKAQYYHERFMNGEYEDDESPTKSFSEENLNTFFKTIQFTFTDVTSLLIAYLKIPLYTINEMPQYGNVNQTNYIQGKTPRINVNNYNQINFDKCEAKEILQKILLGDEFYIQIQSPKFSVKVEEMELSTLAKKRIDKMMFRQRQVIYDTKDLGKIDLASKARDFTNPFKYKVSLEKKIEYLKKQKLDTDLDAKLEKVRQARTQNNDDDIRNRVYNNSLYKHPKHQSQSRRPITNNYKNMYKTFIIDYLEKKNDNLLDLTQ